MKMSFTEVPAMFTACVDFYDALMAAEMPSRDEKGSFRSINLKFSSSVDEVKA
jgi:hypothetical protein